MPMTRTLRELLKFTACVSKVLKDDGYEFTVSQCRNRDFYVILCNGKIAMHVYKYSYPLQCLCSVTNAVVNKLREGCQFSGGVWTSTEDEEVFWVGIWVYGTNEYDITWEVRLRNNKVLLKEKRGKNKPAKTDAAEEMSVEDYFRRLINLILLVKEACKDA